MRFILKLYYKTIFYTFTIQAEKFTSQFRNRIGRSVLSLQVYTKNTSALFSRGPSESKRRTLLVLVDLLWKSDSLKSPVNHSLDMEFHFKRHNITNWTV
jgi:hypothetical protein